MTESKKSRFVTNLALFSIIAAAFMIFQNISNLLTVNSFQSRPEFRMAEQMMPSMAVSPTESIIDILLQFAGIIASIGLFNRLNWGRVSYMVVLSVITVWGIVSGIISYLSLSQYLKGYGMESSFSIFILGNILALSISVYLIWKLSTKEIRSEFL
jgi:hypothetical protein